MGHTHYYNFSLKKLGKKASQYEATYQAAIKQCNKVIKGYNKDLKVLDKKHPSRLSGYSVHAKSGEYFGVDVNGTGDLSHEDFSFRAHLLMNDRSEFCKTNQKPYDAVVVACCLIMSHYLPEIFVFESDGSNIDMLDGLILIEDHLSMRVEIPKSIRRELREVS